MIDGSVLITGGSGAFGSAFVRRLLTMESGPARIAVYSRGEYRQFQMAQDLNPLDSPTHPKLRFFIGDVRDRDRLKWAMKEVDVVVHAAALKRIEVGVYNPDEMVQTNVDGARNVVWAAQNSDVKKVILLSSDKAYAPVGMYGATKLVAEGLFLSANNTGGWFGPKFSVCRYGNVWNSTGSVVPVWKEQLKMDDEVTLTDPDCTRFFMRMDEAVDLVLKAIDSEEELHIPTLPAYELKDLAAAMGARVHCTGLPAWEKIHESMSEGNSSDRARRMSVDELKDALRDT